MLLNKVRHIEKYDEIKEVIKNIDWAHAKSLDPKILEALNEHTRLKVKEYSYAHEHVLEKKNINMCDAIKAKRTCLKDKNKTE
jgi:hypothetical protein